MDENIVGKIYGLNLPKLTDQTYNLVFTNRRIVGEFIGGTGTAFLVGSLLGAAIVGSRQKSKAEKMSEVNPEEILSKSKKNFSVDFSNITEVSLKKKYLTIRLNYKQKIIGKKSTFYFNKKQFDEVKSIVMQALPYKTFTN